MKKTSVVVLIPAFNPPDGTLPALIADLKSRDVQQIIVVNDGSTGHDELFDALEKDPACIVLHHAINLGKGRALKTGLNYALKYFPYATHVVTADADGQHPANDIERMISTCEKNPGGFIMGVRSFGQEVPLRSRFGNILTRYIFRFLVGMKLSDTQSGLRAIPLKAIPELLKVTGERYEFELGMLILMKRIRIPVHEMPIETVYLNNNESSKFNPVIDSMKIYFVFLRFMLSSMFIAGLDFVVFIIAYYFSQNILASLIISRIVASLINFFINLKFVFHRSKNVMASAIKYYLLVAFIAALSYLMINFLNQHGVAVAPAKILAETILFFVSFTLQRDFVFNKSNNE